MNWLIFISIVASPLVIRLVVLIVRSAAQKAADDSREAFVLSFPSDLDEKAIQAWLRSISASLRRGGMFSVTETVAFEIVATDRGIAHHLIVPANQSNYVVGQLRTHIPGVRAEPIKRKLTHQWNDIVEVGMTNPLRPLRIPEFKSLAAALLAAVQGLDQDEAIVTQWVITPAKTGGVKEGFTGYVEKDNIKFKDVVLGFGGVMPEASTQEVQERKAKFEETNVQAIGRVAAASSNPNRSKQLVNRVIIALQSTRSNSTNFEPKRPIFGDLSDDIKGAGTPDKYPAQLNVLELSGVIGWPIGRPHVAGLPQGSSRHLPATESIPRDGRIIGMSNFPGNERPVAIGRLESLKHLHVMGPTGVGKTTLLANLVAQDMQQGYGVILMESKGDLFYRTLDYIPYERLKDVIVLDVTERDYPVGFNILEQGNPAVVIDQLTDLFQSLYADTKGVWMRELMYHGLHTLAENGGMTFVDLAALISPRTIEEQTWADELKKNVKDVEIRQFWDRWNALNKSEQERNSSPLHNRIWQLVSRPELRNIIGQTTSSFQMDDVIRENKILLINLAGVPAEAASLAGTLIINAVWSSVQRVQAEKSNYLYVDEFQDFMRLPIGAEEMLAKARAFNLGMTLAHQHLRQLTDDVLAGVLSNARSKIYFQTSTEDSRAVLRALATNDLTESDLQRLENYEAFARVAVGTGSSSPVSMKTMPPAPSIGATRMAIQTSAEFYGRDVADVQTEIKERRKGKPTTDRKPLNIGIKEWDQ